MKKEIRQLFTKREIQVIRFIAKGYTSAQIAESLKLSPHTIGVFRKHIMKKSNCHSVWEVTNYAREHKIIKT